MRWAILPAFILVAGGAAMPDDKPDPKFPETVWFKRWIPEQKIFTPAQKDVKGLLYDVKGMDGQKAWRLKNLDNYATVGSEITQFITGKDDVVWVVTAVKGTGGDLTIVYVTQKVMAKKPE